MCLSIPGRVIEIKQSGEVVVDYETEKRVADFSLVDLKLGDYVIVSNKMIISKVEKEKAIKFLEVINHES